MRKIILILDKRTTTYYNDVINQGGSHETISNRLGNRSTYWTRHSYRQTGRTTNLIMKEKIIREFLQEIRQTRAAAIRAIKLCSQPNYHSEGKSSGEEDSQKAI